MNDLARMVGEVTGDAPVARPVVRTARPMLAASDRMLTVLAGLQVLGAGTSHEVAELTGIRFRTVSQYLGRWADRGAVEAVGPMHGAGRPATIWRAVA